MKKQLNLIKDESQGKGAKPICSYTSTATTHSMISDLDGGHYVRSGAAPIKENYFGRCCYCESELVSKVLFSDGNPTGDSSYGNKIQGKTISLFNCENCGWWYLDIERNNSKWQLFLEHIFGIAKYYDVSSIEVPINELREYLAKNHEHIANINPKKFELLMQDCLRDLYAPCEVIHTGKSGDGGIDLMMVLEEKETYLVQVKRHKNVNKKEGVKVVRELNGVLLREGKAKGMVITTAHDFTKSAISESQIKTNLTEKYTMKLFSFDNIVEMLRLPKISPYTPWDEHIKKILNS